MFKCKLLLLPFLSITSCSDPGDRREFYYLYNEQYRLLECADIGDRVPNDHAYFNVLTRDRPIYTDYFDTEKSLLELRVDVDEKGEAHGYGFIELYKNDGSEVINLKIESYLATKIDYQWGYFRCNQLSETDYIYCLGKSFVRFKYPVFIEKEGKEVLITFNYVINKFYEYPDAFKDLSWLT